MMLSLVFAPSLCLRDCTAVDGCYDIFWLARSPSLPPSLPSPDSILFYASFSFFLSFLLSPSCLVHRPCFGLVATGDVDGIWHGFNTRRVPYNAISGATPGETSGQQLGLTG